MTERGRHIGLDRIYRNCPICLKRNVYTLEDEYHFSMVCPDYDNIRLDFFPSNMVENV